MCLNIFNDTETFVRIEVDECSVQFLDVRSVPSPQKLSKSQIVESVGKENDSSDLEACSTSERGVNETKKSNPLAEQRSEPKAQTTNDKTLNTSELENQKLPKLFNPLQEPLSCFDDTQITAVIVPRCSEFNHTVIKPRSKEEHPGVVNRALKNVTNLTQKLSKYKLHKCDLRIELDDPAQLMRQIRRNSGTHRMEGDLVNVDTLVSTTQQKSSDSEIRFCLGGDKSLKRSELAACGEGGERPDVHNKNSTLLKRSSYNGHPVCLRRVKHTEIKINEKAEKVLTIDRKIQECTQNEVSSTTQSSTCQNCGCNVETSQVLPNKCDGIQKQSSLSGYQQLSQMMFLGKPVDENADKLQNNTDESPRASKHRDAINYQSASRTNRRTPWAIYTGDVSFARAVLEKWIKNFKDGEDQSA